MKNPVRKSYEVCSLPNEKRANSIQKDTTVKSTSALIIVVPMNQESWSVATLDATCTTRVPTSAVRTCQSSARIQRSTTKCALMSINNPLVQNPPESECIPIIINRRSREHQLLLQHPCPQLYLNWRP